MAMFSDKVTLFDSHTKVVGLESAPQTNPHWAVFILRFDEGDGRYILVNDNAMVNVLLSFR